jgi:hypothetical protein
MKRFILGFLVGLLIISPVKAYTKKQCKVYVYKQVIKKGWTKTDYDNLVKLWNKESNWNAKAVNKRSGACGIAQALPCKKMKSYGKDYRMNCKTQIRWGLDYIKKRYKTPTRAWQHFQRKHWY